MTYWAACAGTLVILSYDCVYMRPLFLGKHENAARVDKVSICEAIRNK